MAMESANKNSDIIWTCTFCKKVPSRQSLRTCPICGRTLIAWDRSKDPLERQPEWPKPERKAEKNADEKYVDYTKFYGKK